MLPVQNGEQRVLRVEQSKQGKHQIMLLCLWCNEASFSKAPDLHLGCMYHPVLAYICSTLCMNSPWQMPHALDVSNILGTCAIFVCNTLRNILIDSYRLQLQSATVCTPTRRSALLSHNPHQHLLWFVFFTLAILAILQ